MSENVGIHIGTDKNSVIYVGEAILAILQEPREEMTIQKALEALQIGCKVDGTTVTHCNIRMGEVENFELEDE